MSLLSVILISVGSSLVVILVVWQIMHRKTIRKMSYLLDAMEDKEYNFRFSKGRFPFQNETNKMLNRIHDLIEKDREEIRHQEMFYAQILDLVATGVMAIDLSSQMVIYCNRRCLEMVGISSLSSLRQLRTLNALLYETIVSMEDDVEKRVTINTESQRRDFSVNAFSTEVYKERSKTKHAVRIYTMNDVSEMISSNESESWTRLIRVMTHEIMNTITPISTLSDVLSKEIGTGKDTDIKAGLETISVSTENLIKFVNSYRDLTHVSAPNRKAFFVRDLVKRVIDLSSEMLAQADCTCTFQELNEDVLLYADEEQISRIFINLIRNATQAGATNIEMKAQIDKRERVQINVSNNGEPISKANKEEIFIPFFTTKENGSGIGLSLSRQIMRVHGGSLTLLRSDTTGTTFSLLFR